MLNTYIFFLTNNKFTNFIDGEPIEDVFFYDNLSFHNWMKKYYEENETDEMRKFARDFFQYYKFETNEESYKKLDTKWLSDFREVGVVLTMDTLKKIKADVKSYKIGYQDNNLKSKIDFKRQMLDFIEDAEDAINNNQTVVYFAR